MDSYTREWGNLDMGKPQNQSATEPDDGEIDFLSDWGDEATNDTPAVVGSDTKRAERAKERNSSAVNRYDVDGSILQRIVWHPEVGAREKLLTLQLYDMYGEEDFEIERGVLGAELGMSVQQITKLLTRMKAAGLIDWERAYNEPGTTKIRHVTGCIYRITA